MYEAVVVCVVNSVPHGNRKVVLLPVKPGLKYESATVYVQPQVMLSTAEQLLVATNRSLPSRSTYSQYVSPLGFVKEPPSTTIFLTRSVVLKQFVSCVTNDAPNSTVPLSHCPLLQELQVDGIINV